MAGSFQTMRKKLPLQFQIASGDVDTKGTYRCDTAKDLDNLPAHCSIGSIAFVENPPSVYMRTSTGKWVLQAMDEEDEAWATM